MRPEDCIFFQLAKSSQAGTRFWANAISDLNVTATQGMALNFLYFDDHITAVELGKRTLLDSATLTGILDRLVVSDLIERKLHPDDRRAILVCLTPKGRETAEKLQSAMKDANREFLKTLDQDEQTILKKLLGKLRK
jgi:MarR family transcriptional regulator, organic hydroperoxide resistance regulator